MCTVTVEIDQDLLRDMRPDLASTAAIRLWAQQLIDMRIRQMELEDEETMSIEDAREMTLAAVRDETPSLPMPQTCSVLSRITCTITASSTTT